MSLKCQSVLCLQVFSIPFLLYSYLSNTNFMVQCSSTGVRRWEVLSFHSVDISQQCLHGLTSPSPLPNWAFFLFIDRGGRRDRFDLCLSLCKWRILTRGRRRRWPSLSPHCCGSLANTGFSRLFLYLYIFCDQAEQPDSQKNFRTRRSSKIRMPTITQRKWTGESNNTVWSNNRFFFVEHMLPISASRWKQANWAFLETCWIDGVTGSSPSTQCQKRSQDQRPWYVHVCVKSDIIIWNTFYILSNFLYRALPYLVPAIFLKIFILNREFWFIHCNYSHYRQWSFIKTWWWESSQPLIRSVCIWTCMLNASFIKHKKIFNLIRWNQQKFRDHLELHYCPCNIAKEMFLKKVGYILGELHWAIGKI